MDYPLQLFLQNRRNTLHLLRGVDFEKANFIPPNFRNNILWNAGHILFAQQVLMYQFSGLPINIPDGYAKLFGENTQPKPENYTAADYEYLKTTLEETANQTVADYQNGRFQTYQKFHSDYHGISMSTIEECLHFMNYHEGLHFGYMLAIRRAITGP